jgi:hypothetical protein
MPIDSSTSTPIDVGANYPVQFQVDPKVMDMLQQNAAKIKDMKIHGETPVELQDMLEQISGDLNKFDMAFVSSDNRSLILNIAADAPTLPPPAGAGLPEGIGGRANPFLTASFILVLVVVMTQMMKQQSQQKLVEKKLDIMAQNWGFELAVRAADEIMKSAKTEAMMHYLLAASAGAQLGMAAANGAVGAGMMAKSIHSQRASERTFKANYESKVSSAKPTKTGNDIKDAKAQQKHQDKIDRAKEKYEDAKANRWGSISQRFQTFMFPMQTIQGMTEQTAKFYENMVQGLLKVEKARHDAALKILEGYQDIARRISQTSSESFKEMQQNIDSEADFMTKIIDKNYQTFAFRIH